MLSHGLRLFGLALGLLGAAGPAHAQSVSPDEGAHNPGATVGYGHESDAVTTNALIDRGDIESMPQLVDSLLQTIIGLTHYRKPGATLRVTKVSRAQIERTICNEPCAVKAWYLPEEGIFLDESLTPETNLIHRSILFHELVHWVQDVNGEAASLDPCHRWLQREQQAYELQYRYLALIGDNSNFMQMVGNQSSLITSRTVCRGWNHPAEADQPRQVFRSAGQMGMRQ
jgi:hypothetical protein